MIKSELGGYLIEHSNNKSAFQAFVDRNPSEASFIIYIMAESPEEIENVNRLSIN